MKIVLLAWVSQTTNYNKANQVNFVQHTMLIKRPAY